MREYIRRVRFVGVAVRVQSEEMEKKDDLSLIDHLLDSFVVRCGQEEALKAFKDPLVQFIGLVPRKLLTLR